RVPDGIRDHLRQRGASFWPELLAAAGVPDERIVLAALWDLVWAGEVTNDTIAPMRPFLIGRPDKARRPALGRRPVVARANAARTGALAHRGRTRASDATPRTPRRAHARGGPGRRRAGWLRGRVRGAAGARGVGQGPAGLLRRRSRRRAVRASWGGRTDPRPPRDLAGSVGPRACRGGPGPAVRGGPALAPRNRAGQRPPLEDRGRLRRARGRRTRGVPRARRSDLAHVRGGRRRGVDRCSRLAGQGRPAAADRALEDRWRARGRIGVRRGPSHGRVRRRLPGARPSRLVGNFV